MSKNKKLALKYNAKILPFKELPNEACYAIIHYMAVDGEAWEVSDELAKSFEQGWNKLDYRKVQNSHKKAIAKSLKFYTTKYGNLKFGYVNLPTSIAKQECLKRMKETEEEINDFGYYHNWYIQGGEMPKHTNVKKWPCILSSFDDELFQDGWHRFHRYIQLGCKTIPCVFY